MFAPIQYFARRGAVLICAPVIALALFAASAPEAAAAAPAAARHPKPTAHYAKSAARHAKPTTRARRFSHLAPSLRRMLAQEFGPGGPSASGAHQLEKEEQLERETAAVPAVLAARPERPLLIQSTTPGLALDALVNDKTVTTCTACQGMPIAQDEASVAVHGNDVLVSFNDIRSRCGLPTRQNIGYSTDGGATFIDNGGVPKDGGGGNVWGDASVAVNHKSGEFYIAGLYQIPSGIGGFRGHFNGASFVPDGGRVTAPSAVGDFYDKPWMTVDSLSGNVYFTWTNFAADGSNRIQIVRCDANLTPLGPAQILNDLTLTWGAQFSQIAIGPGGVVYVIWQQYLHPTNNSVDGPLSVAIRRSDNFGATWGPITYIAPPHAVNDCTGGPGFLRTFASLQPTIAVDNTNGPHRGRVYVAWDSSIDFLSNQLVDTTTLIETEPNNTPATANPLVPGGKLRALKNGLDEDWFSMHLNAGDTFYLSDVIDWVAVYDSTREDVGSQIYAPDLSGTLHLAANGSGTSGSLLYTAPRTATYYLRFYTTVNSLSPIVQYTALFPAGTSAGPEQDARDQVMSWSDDGTNWSAPVRMNDSAPGADAQYPCIGVDGRGRVYCGWMDWRDDHESGTASTQYMAMSGDGGVTWGSNVRLGDAVSGWSTNVCQSNGNTQGDYQMIAVDGDRVVLAFTDGRLGDPDIFVDASVFSSSASAPAEFLADAGQDASFQIQINNDGNFGRELSWQLTDGAGWLTGTTSGLPTVAAHSSATVTVSLHGTGVAGDSSVVRLALSDPLIPGYSETVSTVVRLTAPLAVQPPGSVALFFAPPEPTPSTGPVTLRYGLPSPGRVRLAVYSVLGARVRTLVDGPAGAGPHALAWDGRDSRGKAVPAGVYLARLDAGRSSLTRRVIVAP